MFPITPRFSPSVVTKLLQASNACHVFVSGENAVLELVREAIGSLHPQSDGIPGISLMPSYDELYHTSGDFVPLPSRQYDPSALATISHSSGRPDIIESVLHLTMSSRLNILPQTHSVEPPMLFMLLNHRR